MPNIWTHILFCEDVIDIINAKHPYTEHDAYMKLGAQGPDPFFYHHFWSWMKQSQANRIGTLIHTEKCGDFLMDLIEHAKNCSLYIQSYVFGFITHHILDRNTHPYVHYRAGYKGNDHQKLEIIIDTVIMEKYHHLKTWKVPVFKEIDVGYSISEDLVRMLHSIITQHFEEVPFTSPAYIQKSYRDMKRALKILFDPHGWKNKLLKSFISAYSHRPITDDVDYLNMHHTTWFHPGTKEASTKSFIDLYNQSLVEGVTILSEVLAYWRGRGVSRDNLIKLIGNIS